MTANPFLLGPAMETAALEGSGAGYTVWRHRGRSVKDPWYLAFSGQDDRAARAMFDRLAQRTSWGCVRLLDPAGRELAIHLGRAGAL